MELLQGSLSDPERNDSSYGSHSVLGWNDSGGVILSWDGTILGELFGPVMERLQGSPTVLESND